MHELNRELELAKRAALAAGGWLRHVSPTQRLVDSDAGRDIKLAADREAEAIVLGNLRSSGFPVLAEESGMAGNVDPNAPCWIVDPLDGSMNYSRGLGLGCVSVALCQGEEPLLGVVYDFYNDELFSGIAGAGVWCNGQQVTVSSVTRPDQAVLATGFPVARSYGEGELRGFVSSVQAFKKVRMLGTAALSLAYVSCGRVDAYWEEGIQLWDVAAGLALLKAAGGWSICKKGSEGEYLRNVMAGPTEQLFDGVWA